MSSATRLTGTASRPPQRMPSSSLGGPSSIMPTGTTPRPPQFMSGGSAGPTPSVSNPNISSDWLGGRTGGAPTSPGGVQPSIPTTTSQPRPLKILKQVWDLSDQYSDSMLSLREFCFALYLMERYREGHPLPAALPSNIMYNETLLSMTGQPKVAYGSAAWGPGFGQQPTRSMAPVSGMRPPVPVTASQPDGVMVNNQHKSGAPVLEDSFLNQHDGGEQSAANSMIQDGTASEKKAPFSALLARMPNYS